MKSPSNKIETSCRRDVISAAILLSGDKASLFALLAFVDKANRAPRF